MPRRKNGLTKQAIKEETKRARFERLATARMNKALNCIRLLGNLAGPTYEWMPRDIDRIHDSLVECLTDTLHRFDRPGKTKTKNFSFAKTTHKVSHANGNQNSEENRKSV